MNWFGSEQAIVGISVSTIEFAVNWLLQSTVLILCGLAIGRLLKSSGSAVQSALYRTTLLAVLLCPVATWALSLSGISGWSLALPADWGWKEAADQAETPKLDGKRLVVLEDVPKKSPAAGPPAAALEIPVEPRAVAARKPTSVSTAPPVSEQLARGEQDLALESATARSPELVPSLFGYVGLVIVTSWVCGSLLLVARLIKAHCCLAGLRRGAVAAEASTLATCHELSTTLEVTPPDVLRTPLLPSPCLTGLRRPAVLLPETLETLSLREVLLHELAHLRRHDCHWNLVRQVVTCLLYFQPLLWVLSRRIEETAEEVCDDYVVQMGGDRQQYAHRLVDLAELSSVPAAAAGVGIVSFRSMLGKRVARILDTSRTLSTRVGNLILGLVLIGGLLAATTTGLIGLTSPPSQAETQVQEEASPLKEDGLSTVRGKVIDPEGQPFDGATVEIQHWIHDPDEPKVPLATTASKSDGSFEVSYPEGKHVTLVASAKGLGAAIMPSDAFTASEQPTLRLVKDDLPVQGQVVDLEGNPLAGVTVHIGSLAATADENLDGWLAALRRGEIMWEAAGNHFKSATPQNPANIPDTVTTDDEGRFSISGIGRERRISLALKGPTVAYTEATVVTRDMQPVVAKDGMPDPDWSSEHTVYGANFQIVAQPTQPIEGVVRDAKTGQPLAGVTVESYRMRPHGISGRRLLRTKSDEQGRYRLIGMPKGPGRRIIAVPSDDQPYLMRELDVPDQPGIEPVSFDLELHRGVWITGQVTDRGTNDPIGGQSVNAQYYPYLSNPHAQALPEYDDDGNTDGYQQRYKVDEQGHYRLVGLPGKAIVGIVCWGDQSYPRGQGSEAIQGADKSGHFPTFRLGVGASTLNPTILREVDIPEDAVEFVVDFQLEQGRTIQVTTTSPKVEPIKKLLTIGAVGRASWEYADGPQFDIVGLRKGRERTLLVHDEENRLGKAMQVSPENTPDELTIELLPCVTVRGKLVDDNEQPISGARIRFSPRPGGDYSPELKNVATDAEGVFEHDGVLPGTNYDVMVESIQEGFSTLAKNLEVHAGETIDLGTIDLTSDERPEPMRSRPALRTVTAKQEAWIRIRGTVLDPVGQPFEGAKIEIQRLIRDLDELVKPFPTTESGPKGQFEISCPKLGWDDATIVASAKGFGPGLALRSTVKADEQLTLELVKDDVPLRGRVLDLEGKPLAGITVSAFGLAVPEEEKLEPWLEALRRGESFQEAWYSYFQATTPRDPANVLVKVTTDDDGRFTLNGFGRERRISLALDGPTIAYTRTNVVTRDMEPVVVEERAYDPDNSRRQTVYGANFQIVVQPTQPIEGVVRDAETGRPLVGVVVHSYRMSPTSYSERMVRTRSDNQGHFRLVGMPKGPGRQILALPNDDQPYLMRKFDVPDKLGNDPIQLELDLHRGIWITGRLTDKATGEPVVWHPAHIQYYPYASNPYALALPQFKNGDHYGYHYGQRYMVDQNGQFRLVGLPGKAIVGAALWSSSFPWGQGSESIEGANSRGYFPTFDLDGQPSNLHPTVMREIDIPEGNDEFTVDLQLERGRTIHVTAVGASNEKIHRLWTASALPHGRVQVADEPHFDIVGLRAGTERTLLIHDQENRLGRALQISADNLPSELNVELLPCITVRGRIVDDKDQPISGASVSFGPSPGGDFSPDLNAVSTDEKGFFEHDGVLPGTTYGVIAESVQHGGSLLTQNLEVHPGETIDLGTIDITREERPEPMRSSMNSIDSLVRESHSAEPIDSGHSIHGQVHLPDGKPAIGADVALIAMSVRPARGGDLSSPGEVLAEGKTDENGDFQLSFAGAASKTHRFANVIARTDGMAVAWKEINLDNKSIETSLDLAQEELIEIQLVNIEGQPAAGLQLRTRSLMTKLLGLFPSRNGVGYHGEQYPNAWLPSATTDDEGKLTIHGVAKGLGVMLDVVGDDRFAPQEIALNTGMPEQRGERDGTYRPLVKNIAAGETATLPLAPAQLFEGLVTYEDTGKPAAGARLTIWASQQEYGSMTLVAGEADANGRYHISPKPGIRFGVTTYPPEGMPYLARRTPFDKVIRWKDGDTSRQVDVQLPRGILVQGKIIEQGTNTPVPNASIQYLPETSNNPNTADDILTGWQGIQLSDDEGEFAIAVLPGPGRLMINGPEAKYVIHEIGSRTLRSGKEGGQRNYAHAILEIDPDESEEQIEVNISLQPGGTAAGRVVDERGISVDEVLIVSRTVLFPRSLTWRGQMPPTLGGRFELSGLEPEKVYPVSFLDAKHRRGATVELSASSEPRTVVLQTCGEARARFIDPDGEPIVGFRPGLHMVVTPGAHEHDSDAARRGELLADADFVSNIDRTNYWPGPITDDQGQVSFPALIPGAQYRFSTYEDGKPRLLRQFQVKAGEQIDLGEMTIDLEN